MRGRPITQRASESTATTLGVCVHFQTQSGWFLRGFLSSRGFPKWGPCIALRGSKTVEYSSTAHCICSAFFNCLWSLFLSSCYTTCTQKAQAPLPPHKHVFFPFHGSCVQNMWLKNHPAPRNSTNPALQTQDHQSILPRYWTWGGQADSFSLIWQVSTKLQEYAALGFVKKLTNIPILYNVKTRHSKSNQVVQSDATAPRQGWD